MELRYSDADEAFRAELRAWLVATLPTIPPSRRATRGSSAASGTPTGSAGCSTPATRACTGRREFGGRGASPTEQLIFYEETAPGARAVRRRQLRRHAARGPDARSKRARDEQKAEHLPKILRGEEVWCQGFSEPGAGSDLASLRTRAERDGDDYVLNGQKIWCSFGQIADVGEFLVRTDPDAPKHRGISWLILPMDLPGIEVRPLKTVLGSSEFAEVFLTDVRVPVANRVGAENDGWRVTNVTLKYERGTAFVSELVDSLRLVEDLAPLVHDAGAAPRARPLRAGARRAVGAHEAQRLAGGAHGAAGAGAMVMKLAYSEARQRFGELCLRVLDRDALHVDGNELVEERLRVLALTIAAGASQIQRNIIGERVLGFPKGAALMDLDLSDDQVALRDGIASMLEGRFDADRIRAGFDRAMFAELAEAGVFSLARRRILVGRLRRRVRAARRVLRARTARRVAALGDGRIDGVVGGSTGRRRRSRWSSTSTRSTMLVVLDADGVWAIDAERARPARRRRGRSIRSRRSRASTRSRGRRDRTPTRAERGDDRARRSPPRSSSAWPIAAPSSRSPTRRSACSSTARSRRSRRSSTSAPTCSCAPRSRGPRCTPRARTSTTPTSRDLDRAIAGAKVAGRRSRDRERQGRDAGVRRHGLHVGGRRAPLPEARVGARHSLRLGRRHCDDVVAALR